MATTRLRKAFHYPSESDSDNGADELDEEHQERLIADLRKQDAQRNDLYRKLFLAIPLLGALSFLYIFVLASTSRERVIALLSISSLMCTAYILHFMPIEAPERKGKRPVYQVEADKGPVDKYLVYLNGGLATLILLASLLSLRKGMYGRARQEALPAIIFGLIMFVRKQLAPLDLEELQKARYEYKGA